MKYFVSWLVCVFFMLASLFLSSTLYAATSPILLFSSNQGSGTYIIPVSSEIGGLNIGYLAHSQSMTNYRQNSVSIRILDKNGVELTNKSDFYNSQSVWGQPIPGYWHWQTFNTRFHKGEQFQLEITAQNGDYVNYVSDLIVYSYNNSCSDFAERILENKNSFQQQYKLSNNTWGRGTVKKGVQCVGSTGSWIDQFVWKWDWPVGKGDNVKAYPEIIYGFKPFDAVNATKSWLPKKIADIGKFNVTHSETQYTCSGKYNMAFEGWITSSAIPSTQTITHEVMVWEKNQDMTPDGSYITAVTIDNISYDLYTGTRQDGTLSWAYIAFVNTSNSPINALNVKSILDYLVTNNYLPDSSFLASWEFGAEVIEGKCEVLVRDYRIDTGLAAISITTPNNGEHWYTASENTVQWTVSNPANVIVYFSKDRGSHWQKLGKVLANKTSFSWMPNADNVTSSGLMKVCVAGTNLCDVSDVVFTLTNLSAIPARMTSQ